MLISHMRQRLERCESFEQAIETVLTDAIGLQGAEFGNVQLLVDDELLIVAQRGFSLQFLETFRRVSAEDGTACGRALRLAVLEKAHGRDDPEATVLMNNLADAYIHRHRYADAERLLKRSIAVTDKAFGADHPDVAQALNNLAALYAREVRNAEAEQAFKLSVATFEKTLGPNHPDLADVLENLAGLKDQGRNADAQAFLRRSMAIRKAASRPI